MCISHALACSYVHVHVYAVFAMLCILIDALSMVMFLPLCYATGIEIFWVIEVQIITTTLKLFSYYFKVHS